MIGDFFKFESREALADTLLGRIRDWSDAQPTAHRLELSGGSTPVELLAAMKAWQPHKGLRVLPVDDRCVAHDHAHSNYKMFNDAIGAHIPTDFLFDDAVSIADCVESLRTGAGAHSGARFTILGMGPDGHTASLFPGSADLPMGLDACAPSFISAQPTMDPMVPRITMTAPYILASDHLVLHIHGQGKLDLVEAAQSASPDTYPIAHFLRHPSKTLDVYYAD